MFIFVLGTRAEAIKLKPLIDLFYKKKEKFKVYLTGQHNLSEFKFYNAERLFQRNEIFFKSILSAVKFSIDVMFQLLKKISPRDVLIVQGDTMATASGAIAGWLKGAVVVHIESGLRTGNLFEPFPEEISRIITDKFSTICFAPTYLASLKTKKKITYIVRNTVIDSLEKILKKDKIHISDDGFILVSIHRQENIRNKKRMERLVDQLLSFEYKIKFIMYKNTEYYLKKYGLLSRLKRKVEIIPILKYDEFIRLLAQAHAVISDSGGLAEECAYLKKPLHIFRKNTERMESVICGIASLGLDLRSFEELLRKYRVEAKYLYGDGNTARRIYEILKERV